MPELPEVETVKQTIAPVITDMKLAAVWEKTPGVFLNPDNLTLPECLPGQALVTDSIKLRTVMKGNQKAQSGRPALNGQTQTELPDTAKTQHASLSAAHWQVHKVNRRGKYLLIFFEQAALLVHLRMTGRLLIKDPAKQLKANKVNKAEESTSCLNTAKVTSDRVNTAELTSDRAYTDKTTTARVNTAETTSDRTNTTISIMANQEDSDWIDLAQTMPDHTHVRLVFEDEKSRQSIWLDFHDTRRFGRIWLLRLDSKGRLQNAPGGFYLLGPEPLSDHFSARQLAKQLARRKKTPVKAALLDQTVLAGLGNIYVDESLFVARLHPARLTGTLDEQAIKRLHRSIRKILRYAISCQGTSLRDYVDGWNQKGRFQECLMVYGRSGQPCRKCGSIIKKTRLAGRTTSFCPNCQPEPRVLNDKELSPANNHQDH